MVKSVMKEIFIILLLSVAILLILGILFYDYIPINRVIPEREAYVTPDNVLQELSESITETEKVEVTYEVTDSYDQTVTKTIMVTVSEKVLVEKEGEFYLDYLKEVDGNLQIKGYNIIKNINNDLNTNIEYELILVNQNNNKEYSQKLERITDKNQMTIPILSEDGYDYTYSWFVGNINFNSILPYFNINRYSIKKKSR